MLDLKFIRENADAVKKAVTQKNLKVDVDALLALDGKLLALRRESEALAAERNAISAQIPKAAAGEKPALVAQSKDVGAKLAEMTAALKPLEDELQLMLYQTPTIPAPDVPVGKSEADNVVVKTWGEKPKFDFKPLDHVELMEKHGWADFKRVPQVSGSRTVGLKGDLVKVEMALWQYVMDILSGRGFVPISVPALANEQAFFGTGHFPFDRESVYEMPKDKLYLAGTAEVVLNSLHAGEQLKEEQLPICYAGFSPCFRREAGSAGKDVRGVIRVHQFYKVEQYIICKNDVEESNRWHKVLFKNTEDILQGLEIPYQVVECCTGDMGAGKYRMNDFECYFPSEGRYRETHSCSTLLDWQARRTNLRYRDAQTGKLEYAHTLNNTGIATPRILVALLENHQLADGRVRVPKALQLYLMGKEILG